MRFAAAIAPQHRYLRERDTPARHFMQRLMGAKPPLQPRSAPVPPQEPDELPSALDERVRLIGEW